MSDTLLDQGEWDALEAELRSALQHRQAAVERMLETQQELECLIERARTLLDRPDEGSADDPEASG